MKPTNTYAPFLNLTYWWCVNRAKFKKAGIRGAPDFIIEVLSPSTAGYDQIDKRYAYENAGVRELWLIDVPSGLLTIYVLPGVSLDLDFMLELRGR